MKTLEPLQMEQTELIGEIRVGRGATVKAWEVVDEHEGVVMAWVNWRVTGDDGRVLGSGILDGYGYTVAKKLESLVLEAGGDHRAALLRAVFDLTRNLW